MILYCRRCGYTWPYKGQAEHFTSCPRCKAHVNLEWGWPEELESNSDVYSGAVLLAITEEGEPIYYDPHYRLPVSYLEERDEWVELQDQPRDLLALLSYQREMGVTWMIPTDGLIDLYQKIQLYSS